MGSIKLALAAALAAIGTAACAEPSDYWLGFAPTRHQPLVDAVTVMVDHPFTPRPYFYAGTITLRDPDTGLLIGTYRFGSGGFGRGSAPAGEYVLGRFRVDGNIGPRWELHQPGIDPGEDGNSAWDPRIRDMRTWLQLHMAHRDGRTLGCFAVLGGPEVWERFLGQMGRLADRLGRVAFTVGGPQEPQRSPLMRWVSVGVLV